MTEYNIYQMEMAFFNHDNNGAEDSSDRWEKRREEWLSFMRYLSNNKEIKAVSSDTPSEVAK